MDPRRKILIDELTSRVTNKDIAAVVSKFIETEVPDIFFYAPGSSSGKYHPDFSLGDGGLLRHTIVMLNYIDQLKRFYNLDDASADVAYCAGAIHDTFKGGPEAPWPETLKEHPDLVSNALGMWWTKGSLGWLTFYGLETFDLLDDYIYDIRYVAGVHMGIWGPTEVEPVAMTATAQCVASADYAATRKFLNDGAIWQLIDDVHLAPCSKCGTAPFKYDETCPECDRRKEYDASI